MSILSIPFFLLVMAAVCIYWLTPAAHRWWILLLAGGVYIWLANEKSWGACLVMLFMILTAYASALLFILLEGRPGLKRAVMVLAVILEAGLLIRLKDMGFFLQLFHKEAGLPGFLDLAVPMGVSYYTVSLIGYILDTYWGTQEAEKNPFKFLLFGSYFPLLTSGPIVRYRDTGKELFERHRFSWDRLCFAAQRILWGIFKKIVVSDRLAVLVSLVYSDPDTYQGLYVWIAMALFVLQLYTDFSGCLDVLYGVSELFGIRLPENFDLPFAAKNLSEFWRKWHITLGLWLKDYVLYPILKSSPMLWLGGKTRKLFGKKMGKKIPTWCGLFCTWFLIGFWHGGSWNYIIGVGLWQWLVIVLGELTDPFWKKVSKLLKIRTDCFSWHLFQWAKTFVQFMLGLGLFPVNDIREGIRVYQAGFAVFNPWILFDGSLLEMGLLPVEFRILWLSVFLLVASGAVKLVSGLSAREWIARQNLVFRWLVWLGLIMLVLIFGKYGSTYDAAKFIYQGF